MGALDIAIVGPALPAIEHEFGLDSRAGSWIFSAYVLTNLIGTPLMAKLSDRFGRRPGYLFGAVGAAIWVFVFFALLDTGSFPLIVLAVVVALFFHAAMYGPQAAFIAEMFPTKIRYTGASMGYQLAGIFGGALAPIISVALLGRFDTSLVVSLYVVAVLALTTACVLLAPETSQLDLHADPVEEPAPVQ
jgi:MFS family permease